MKQPVSVAPRLTPILSLLLLAGCASRPPIASELERHRLEQRQEGFFTALAARDLERIAAHFADDAVLHVANLPPIRGGAAIHQFFGNLFTFLSASEPVPEAIRMSSSADLAYTTGSVGALLSLVFVGGCLAGAAWRMGLGAVVLTVSLYSASVFNYGTWRAGAWTAENLWIYVVVNLGFMPVLLLTALVYRWAFAPAPPVGSPS